MKDRQTSVIINRNNLGKGVWEITIRYTFGARQLDIVDKYRKGKINGEVYLIKI